jgi:spore coat polysaccharide biosynthesis protein SpsF
MITAILQARIGSTRLPNKVFADLVGRPLLWHVVERVRRSRQVQQIVVATTTNVGDNALEEWCQRSKISIYRGSEEDVLDRFYGAATWSRASIIVRVTTDDPFKDPQLIDQVVDVLMVEHLDFAYNNKPPSFPEGLDTEVFTYGALKIAHAESKDPFEREHLTQYFYRHPERFKQRNISCEQNLSWLRWTIDTADDLEMARKVYEHLYREGDVFLMDEILKFLQEHPDISSINASVPRSAMYTQQQRIAT